MAESKIYGYARVSTKEQNEDRQIIALKNFGIEDDNIIIDKASGKDTDREGYQFLRNRLLRSGDTLVIKELDRLSRKKEDIKAELEYFKSIGVRVKILDIPTTLCDINQGQEWVLDMINNILIEVLGSIAQAEREKITARQQEGIAAAKARGAYKGRKPLFVDKYEFEHEYKLVESGEHTATFMMKKMNLKRNTFYRLVKDMKENKGQWAE
jgi:DNA invertase Pin-like site-specific DNA recombinase